MILELRRIGALLAALSISSPAPMRVVLALEVSPYESTGGVTLSLWNSSAGVLDPSVMPASHTVIPTLNFSVDTDGKPFSAEAVGTLVVPSGNYSFSLSSCVGVGLTAMVWVDGHLVARSAPAGVFLAGHDLGGSGKRSESVDDVLGFGSFPNAALGGGYDKSTGKYLKAVIVRVWHTPLNDSSTGGAMCTSWVHNGDCSQQKPDQNDPNRVTIAVSFSHGATAHDARLAPQRPVLSSMLTPQLPDVHQKRLALQKDFSGWGSWIPDNILALTDYASGATITTMMCQVSSDTCLIVSQIESRNDHDPFGLSSDTRVGPHAWDGSYAQSYNSWRGDQSKPAVPNTKLNVSIEWSGGMATNGELHGLATLVDHIQSTSDQASVASTFSRHALLDGYRDLGAGYCTNSQGKRPESYLCDSSSQGSGCPSFTASACAILCKADTKCAGFMIQNMSQYQAPPTCNLVTTAKPNTAGRWVDQNRGNALEISGVDGETRDHCYAKNVAPPTPSSRGYKDVGQGYCCDANSRRPESWVCDGDGCPKATEESCRNICNSDATCTGFMVQDMSIYGRPPTCNIVTTTKPSSPGSWSNENRGNGLSIDRHDHEIRDHCWKKTGPPAPPGPPPPPSPGEDSDFVLVLQARFAWWRAGVVSAASNGTSLTLAPYGRPTITVAGFGEAVPIPQKLQSGMGYCSDANTSQACIAFALDQGRAVAFSTVANATAASTAAVIASNRAALYDAYAAYGDFAWAAEAVGAAVGWNFKFAPSELGPHLPVSPGWAGGYIGPYSDFQEGGSFGWDCTFASYLASLASKKMAYSALITIVKSKTSNGFVPNCATAGAKSQDRTEPNAGAKVLLELYKKYGDLWIVELLFDDLLDTNNWIVRERTLAPLNLISLGTSTDQFAKKPGSTTEYSCDSHDPNSGCMNAMQNSRYESGQDNSPMYDQPGVDSTTVINQNGEFMPDLNAPGNIEQGLVGPFVKMPLYDVGMSALLVSEAQALSELAVLLGRNDTAAMLAKRCVDMRTLIQAHLWNDQLGIYSNKFSGNSSFYPRISPTSFFPMFARSPTDDQAKRMVKEWLHSPTRFCVSPTGDMKGNSDMCYWGLPSISADDSAGVLKNDLGYWRGFVWGPLSILTYWSLQEYDHVPEVQHGRKMMVDQLSKMMARVWHSHRHICENFTPHKGKPGAHGGNDDSTDCTGGKFYHWGALPALELLIDNGMYNLTFPPPPPSFPPSPPKPVGNSATISIDASTTGQKFNHVWKRSFGSGHAALGLRKDWQAQLARAANELGLQGVRQHGLLDDDVGIVVGHRQYNWTNVDILWDAIRATNSSPIVELSFMPSLLANCSWDGDHDSGWIPGSHNISRPGTSKCSQSMHYGGVTMPPAVWDDWYHLVRAVVEHAVSRYGVEEVRNHWEFEVWNELWGVSFPEPYMSLFNHSSRAVKDVDPLIKIGGPATMQLNYLNYFVEECERRNITFDFVSSHMYPNDGMCPGSSQPPVGAGGWNADCFPSLVKNARQLLPPDKPLYLTEYSVGCCGENPEPNSAALIFRAIGSLHADVSVLSYWTFSMIFEEESLPAQEMQGTFGLLSTHGVPKPGWEAFRLLHQWAGDTILPSEMEPPWVNHGAVDRKACHIGQYQGCYNNLAPEPACCHPMQPGCQGCGNSACQMSSYASTTLAAAIGKNNTPTLCMELCAGAGWTVFGLNGNECRCGNSDFRTPTKDHHGCTQLTTPGSCGLPCPGNNSASCGDGKHGWDIYTLECPARATPPRVVAFATNNERAPEDGVSVFISYWHDSGPRPPSQRVVVNITTPRTAKWADVAHLYRIDETHAHAVDAWRRMGSPAVPDVAQLQHLQTASVAVAEPLPVEFDSTRKHAVVVIDTMPPNAAYVLTVQ